MFGWFSAASTAMKFINVKKFSIGIAIIAVLYIGFKLWLQREKIEELITDNALAEHFIKQNLETINSKDKMINQLKEDIKTLEKLQEKKETEYKLIDNNNDELKKQISKIKDDECLDNTMHPDLIRLFSDNKNQD